MNLLNHSSNFTKVSDVTIPSIFYNRIKTGIAEMDEMFGEGILPGSATTLTAQAYLTLKELVDANKLVKIGRGESSVWKKTI